MPSLSRRKFFAAASTAAAWPHSLRGQVVQASATVAGVRINVRDMGALGDDLTKDTVALQQALNRCNALGGGTVVMPAGTYLTGALSLHSNTTLQLDDGATLRGSPDMADYPLTQVRWEGKFVTGYCALLSATDAETVTITGRGRVEGSSAIEGRLEKGTKRRLPALMEFLNCRHVTVENIATKQYGMWSIHPVLTDNLIFRNVTVESGADGIDPDSCRHVLIDGCTFRTVDDCIAIKSGRGMEGYRMARPSEDIRISNCTFSDARWACVSIGSEVSGGVRNVVVEHCKVLSAYTHAVYIKSRVGRGAFIEDVTFRDMDVSGCREGFLRINSLNSGLQDQDPVAGEEGIPQFRNLRFINIRVHNLPQLVKAVESHPRKPLDGLLLQDISGTCAKGIEIANAVHVNVRNVSLNGLSGPLLATSHVSGKGLTAAATLPDAALAKIPETVPVPSSAYMLR